MTLTLRALDNTTDIVFIMGETEPPQIIPREKDPSMTVNLGKNIPCTTIPWVRIPHVMGHTIVLDLSADISGKSVCPITRVTIPKVFPTRDPTSHDTYYAISLQYTQRQCHDWINISSLTAPGTKTGAIWFV